MRLNIIQLYPDLPRSKADVSVNLKPQDKVDFKFEVDDKLHIINLNMKVVELREIVIGDRIVTINGNKPQNKDAALSALKSATSTVKLEVMRRQHAAPMPADRQKKIGLETCDGFAYCVVTCTNTNKSQDTFGFSLAWQGGRAFVTAIQPGTPASNHFCVGDALADLDGTPVPRPGAKADGSFLRAYAIKFNKEGKFTAVVERPSTPSTVARLNQAWKAIVPQTEDEELAPDAVVIGREAARMHMMVFRKLQPDGVLTSKDRKPERRNIRISSKGLNSYVASDVEDEDDLRPVEKKSHSAEGFDF